VRVSNFNMYTIRGLNLDPWRTASKNKKKNLGAGEINLDRDALWEEIISSYRQHYESSVPTPGQRQIYGKKQPLTVGRFRERYVALSIHESAEKHRDKKFLDTGVIQR